MSEGDNVIRIRNISVHKNVLIEGFESYQHYWIKYVQYYLFS